MTTKHVSNQKTNSPQWLFAACVFIGISAICSGLAIIVITFFQCDFNWAGDYCGVIAIYTIPFWGPVAIAIGAGYGFLALRARYSQHYIRTVQTIVIVGVILSILIV